jgi:hypothetical protein
LYSISEQVGLLPSSPGSPVAQGRDVQHRFSETMAPETIVPFELTLASVLRESSRSIACFETPT